MKAFQKFILAVLLILIVISFHRILYAERTDDYYRQVSQNLELFRDVYREVSANYVDDINPAEFIRAGIRGMLETLDPYTVFIEGEDSENLHIMTSGKYGGLGIVIGLRGEDKILTVVSPIEGTPADRLGIQAGDQIIEIDGVSTFGFDTQKAASMMRGEPETEVQIRIRRQGVPEAILYTIVREIITVKDVSCYTMIDEEVGYVRLTRFSRKASEELDGALAELESQGVKALIIDLRGNPGGLLESAVEICERFIAKGDTIVTTRGIVTSSNRIIISNQKPKYGDYPIAVLVDGGSASASEIVAGAIQDLDRGVLIGTNTFGKGLVQSLVTFNNGTELKLTTAKYYTPSGRLIQRVDYFSEDNPVIFTKQEISEIDTAEAIYFTANGRKVYGGGGITPDIEVEDIETPDVLVALFRESQFFNFANEYLASSTPAEALEDSLLYDKFRVFLQGNEFDYLVDGQSEVLELREIAEENGFSADFTEHLDYINKQLESVKNDKFEKNRIYIERFLRMEFASRESGTKGRFMESISTDPQLLRAINLLQDRASYDDVLAGNQGKE